VVKKYYDIVLAESMNVKPGEAKLIAQRYRSVQFIVEQEADPEIRGFLDDIKIIATYPDRSSANSTFTTVEIGYQPGETGLLSIDRQGVQRMNVPVSDKGEPIMDIRVRKIPMGSSWLAVVSPSIAALPDADLKKTFSVLAGVSICRGSRQNATACRLSHRMCPSHCSGVPILKERHKI
jgi:hypothetical protein